jgi:hypothetical protein
MWLSYRPHAVLVEESPVPFPVCIIWRRVHGSWDFYCRAPQYDIARIIRWDRQQMGTSEQDYQVTQG